ncbi:MAG: MFS transporter [Gammaproteobacteria bacterium]|nr:MFS transporter [Gammaproteobacteria bacterium]
MRSNWLLVTIALSAGVAAAVGVGKIAPLMPLIRVELGLSLTEGGWVISSFMTIAVLTALPVSLLALRVGVYRYALIALALLSIGGFATAFANSFTHLLIARMIEGIGYIGVAVAGPGLVVSAVNNDDRPLAMGIWATWIPLGMGSVMLITPLLLNVAQWRSVWMILAVFPLLLMVLVGRSFASLRSQTTISSSSPKPDFRTILKPGPFLAAGCFACFSGMFIVVVSFLTTLWTETMGIDLGLAALLTSIVVLLGAPGSILGGWMLQRKFSLRTIVVVGFVFPGLTAMMIFLPAFPWWIQGLSAVIFMSLSTLTPGVLFGLGSHFVRSPTNIPMVIGVILHGVALGHFLGPILFSALIDAMNGEWAYGAYYFLALVCLGSVLFYRLSKHTHVSVNKQ